MKGPDSSNNAWSASCVLMNQFDWNPVQPLSDHMVFSRHGSVFQFRDGDGCGEGSQKEPAPGWEESSGLEQFSISGAPVCQIGKEPPTPTARFEQCAHCKHCKLVALFLDTTRTSIATLMDRQNHMVKSHMVYRRFKRDIY